MKASIAGTLCNTLVNGEGVRFTVFFQGCSHRCKGCHNPNTWAKKENNRSLNDLFAEIDYVTPLLDGMTLSGGEPFEQPEAAYEIAKYAKQSGLNVWAYTGYTYEQLTDLSNPNYSVWNQLLQEIDVLVDGRFVEELADDTLYFRGSKNQRILHLKNGKIVKIL